MTAKLPSHKLTKISLLALSALLLSSTAFAADESTSSDTVGIQVSSPSYSFSIDPGDSSQEIIKVKNTGSGNQTFYPEVLDFKASDESGAPTFINSKDSESYTHSLASWVTISKEPIIIAPGQTVAMSFTINVPANAEPGGRYAGILFGTKPPETGTDQVAISNKVGSLLLVRVAGKESQSLTIKEFFSGSTSYEKGPVHFTVRVSNNGTIHLIPQGIIEIKNLFGAKVASIDVNTAGGNVLPGTTRKFDKGQGLTWEDEGFHLGPYTATLTLNYGDPTKTITSQMTFWIIPWVQLAIVTGILLLLLAVLVLGMKRYNRYIVSKALRNQKTTTTPPTDSSDSK